MKRVDRLITAARNISRNAANADGTYSISDNEVLQYLNDAQDRMQNLISSAKNIAKIFVTQQILSIEADAESYTIDDRVLLNKQIELVEFSSDGSLNNYVKLEKVHFINRDTSSATYPSGYYKRGGEIFLMGIPSSATGTLRVTYERDLDDLDIPRGAVSAIANGTTLQFDTLTLSTLADDFESTTPGWSNISFCCVTDANGGRKCFNIPITSYNTGTNVLTPNPTPYIYNTSLDSEIEVGDLLTFDKYTTTFSQLPDACEKYLVHYAAAELFGKDSSNDYKRQSDRVAEMEEEILDALRAQTAEVQLVPQSSIHEW